MEVSVHPVLPGDHREIAEVPLHPLESEAEGVLVDCPPAVVEEQDGDLKMDIGLIPILSTPPPEYFSLFFVSLFPLGRFFTKKVKSLSFLLLRSRNPTDLFYSDRLLEETSVPNSSDTGLLQNYRPSLPLPLHLTPLFRDFRSGPVTVTDSTPGVPLTFGKVRTVTPSHTTLSRIPFFFPVCHSSPPFSLLPPGGRDQGKNGWRPRQPTSRPVSVREVGGTDPPKPSWDVPHPVTPCHRLELTPSDSLTAPTPLSLGVLS